MELQTKGNGAPHHGSGVLPLGELVENSQQVDAREKVPPAELVVVTSLL